MVTNDLILPPKLDFSVPKNDSELVASQSEIEKRFPDRPKLPSHQASFHMILPVQSNQMRASIDKHSLQNLDDYLLRNSRDTGFKH
jgi:hypothetical protein